MAKAPTHYDRLGVARNAPDEVIRGAYKALAQKNHPDKNINNPEATTIMQAINIAYDVLSDPQKRADYDARLNQEEMQQRARAQAPNISRPRPAAASTSSSAASYSARASSVPNSPPLQSSIGFGSMLLFLILVGGLFIAFYISGSLSKASRTDDSTASQLAEIPEAADTFVPRETTPRELAECIFTTAKTYNVPPSLLLSLLSVEGGAVGKKTRGPGHTYDLGLMQVNSFWIPAIAQTWKVSNNTALQRVRDDACVNIGISAWILQMALSKGSDLPSQIAFYRSLVHHAESGPADKEYVEKVMKFMELYRPIHRPEDLLGSAAATGK